VIQARAESASFPERHSCDYAAIWKELAFENKTCTYWASANVAHTIRSRPEGKIAMAQANLRLVDGTLMDRSRAPNAVLSEIACAFGNNSNIGRRNSERAGFATIQTSGPEAELFILAEQVESAEKAFHNALLCRNEAQIAYLRDPSIMTLQALEKSKIAEAVALEILDTEIRRLASTRATTVIGLKLKASYAFTDSKLADSIVGDILQL
jgi:hypothetical protein